MFSVFDIAGMGMSAQSLRLNTIASNMANVDSVGSSQDDTYRSLHPVFESISMNSNDDSDMNNYLKGVKVADIVENQAPLQMRYDPNHPKADKDGFVYLPNVNIIQNMADMISASRTFQTNVQMLNTAKEIAQQALNIGK